MFACHEEENDYVDRHARRQDEHPLTQQLTSIGEQSNQTRPPKEPGA